MSDVIAKSAARWTGALEITRADGSVDSLDIVLDSRHQRWSYFCSSLKIRRFNRGAYARGIDIPRDAPGIGPLTRLRRKLR